MKISRLIITIFFVCVCFNLNAQKRNPYYSLLHKGDSLFYNNNYAEAYKVYKESLTYRKHPRISDLLNVVECAIYLNKQKECYNLYKKSILNGLPKNELESILKSNDKFEDKYKNKLLKKFFKWNKEYYSKLNLDLCFELTQLEGWDQGFREGYVYIADSNCRKGYQTNYNKKELKRDSSYFNRIVELTKKYGWLDFDLVGTNTDIVSLIMWHNRNKYCFTDNWKYLKVIIDKQIEIGELDSAYFANYEDYAYYIKNKMQLYGTMVQNCKGKLTYIPIYDIQNVDKRRRGIGLEDLKTNALIRKAELPIDYKSQ